MSTGFAQREAERRKIAESLSELAGEVRELSRSFTNGTPSSRESFLRRLATFPSHFHLLLDKAPDRLLHPLQTIIGTIEGFPFPEGERTFAQVVLSDLRAMRNECSKNIPSPFTAQDLVRLPLKELSVPLNALADSAEIALRLWPILKTFAPKLEKAASPATLARASSQAELSLAWKHRWNLLSLDYANGIRPQIETQPLSIVSLLAGGVTLLGRQVTPGVVDLDPATLKNPFLRKPIREQNLPSVRLSRIKIPEEGIAIVIGYDPVLNKWLPLEATTTGNCVGIRNLLPAEGDLVLSTSLIEIAELAALVRLHGRMIMAARVTDAGYINICQRDGKDPQFFSLKEQADELFRAAIGPGGYATELSFGGIKKAVPVRILHTASPVGEILEPQNASLELRRNMFAPALKQTGFVAVAGLPIRAIQSKKDREEKGNIEFCDAILQESGIRLDGSGTVDKKHVGDTATVVYGSDLQALLVKLEEAVSLHPKVVATATPNFLPGKVLYSVLGGVAAKSLDACATEAEKLAAKAQDLEGSEEQEKFTCIMVTNLPLHKDPSCNARIANLGSTNFRITGDLLPIAFTEDMRGEILYEAETQNDGKSVKAVPTKLRLVRYERTGPLWPISTEEICSYTLRVSGKEKDHYYCEGAIHPTRAAQRLEAKEFTLGGTHISAFSLSFVFPRTFIRDFNIVDCKVSGRIVQEKNAEENSPAIYYEFILPPNASYPKGLVTQTIQDGENVIGWKVLVDGKETARYLQTVIKSDNEITNHQWQRPQRGSRDELLKPDSTIQVETTIPPNSELFTILGRDIHLSLRGLVSSSPQRLAFELVRPPEGRIQVHNLKLIPVAHLRA